MAAFGLVPEVPLEAPEPVLGIWPENWFPVQVFYRMTTQLLVGARGQTLGLRYESLPIVMQACGVARNQYGVVLDQVRAMERHFVHIYNKR